MDGYMLTGQQDYIHTEEIQAVKLGYWDSPFHFCASARTTWPCRLHICTAAGYRGVTFLSQGSSSTEVISKKWTKERWELEWPLRHRNAIASITFTEVPPDTHPKLALSLMRSVELGAQLGSQ